MWIVGVCFIHQSLRCLEYNAISKLMFNQENNYDITGHCLSGGYLPYERATFIYLKRHHFLSKQIVLLSDLRRIFIITMTGTGRLKAPAIPSFARHFLLSYKKTISQLCITWPLWEESIGGSGIPKQRASNADCMPLSWRHHGFIMEIK